MSTVEDNIKTVKAYFAAIHDSPESVAAFYHVEVVQEEFPNRFLPNGARRGLQELRQLLSLVID